MEELKIGLIQLDTDWENPTSNKKKIENILETSSKLPDLVILPEMFLTGFSCETTQNSDVEEENSILDWLNKLCYKHGLAIIGSVKIKENLKYLKNRLLLCDNQGSVQYYDKRHLFPLSGEAKNFSCGAARKVLKLNSWTILPQICYDLRFPVWARNSLNYDLMINVANWPASRKHAWQSLLIARAIENQAYVVGVNRIGTDGNNVIYSGDSCVISPEGEILLDAANNQNMLQITLSKNKIQTSRRTFPFLKDMDSFELFK